MNETIKESVCCKASVTDTTEEGSNVADYSCDNCNRKCDVTEVCVLCDGTGEIYHPAMQVFSEEKGTYIKDGYVEACPHTKVIAED